MATRAFRLLAICNRCFPAIAAIWTQTLKYNQLFPYAVLHKVTLAVVGNKSEFGHLLCYPLDFLRRTHCAKAENTTQRPAKQVSIYVWKRWQHLARSGKNKHHHRLKH